MNNLKEPLLKFDKRRVGEIFTWSAVSEIHKVRTGIYQKNGELISLLTDFGLINPCYPDFYAAADSKEAAVTENIIFYTGAGRRGDQKLDVYNQSLFNAVKSGKAVPLFHKIAVGRWRYLGLWRVADGKYIYDEQQKRMIWKFELHRAA